MIKTASDFRKIARDALSGKWGIAVLAGFLASLLGALSSNLPSFNGGSDTTNMVGQEGLLSSGNEQLAAVGGVILVCVLIFAVAYLIVGSVVGVGYAKFNLDLVDRREELQIGTLFAYFKRWGTAVGANLLQALYVILWMLLFIIPGIIAAYSYAMTNYILAEHPELSAGEAIEESKEMMRGNRFRLFCLQLSFIGWDLLCILSLGIGYLWLTPYKQAATAAFYREVSGTERGIPATVEGTCEYTA